MRDPSGRLWAVTTYFNPVPYRRRLANYRIFRERLAAPLLAVELAYGPSPELAEGDADILVQLRGRDVMWQKERLLNIAVARLPACCDRVVWLDCDVIFSDEDWAVRLERRLDDFALVQAFTRVHYLGPTWSPGVPPEEAIEFARSSICGAIAGGLPPQVATYQPKTERRHRPAFGFAWAARRDLLERHGFYDAAISGGGDLLLAGGAHGCFAEAALRHFMGDRREQHYRAWAEPWATAINGSIGVLDCEILNLWHGDIANRGGDARYERLSAFDYDPRRDIALDAEGAWRWSSDKPALHAYLRDYFRARREDGS